MKKVSESDEKSFWILRTEFLNPTKKFRKTKFLNPSTKFLNPTQKFLNPTTEFLNPTQEFLNPTQEFLNPSFWIQRSFWIRLYSQDLQIWCMFKINITNIKIVQHHLRRRLKFYCTRTWVYSSMTSNMESQSSSIFPPAKFQNCCVTFTMPSCFGCVAPKAGYQQGMDGALALCGLFRRKIEFPKLQAW